MQLKIEYLHILWNDRLVILKTRKLSWLLTISCLTTVFLVILALVNKYSVQMLLSFAIPYLFVGFACYILLMRRKSKSLSQYNSYALTILLYQIYDQISMLLISYSFWAVGLRLISLSLDTESRVIQILLVTLKLLMAILIALTLIYSQKLIRQKAESILAQKVITTLPSWALRPLTIIPILGVVFVAVTFRGDNQIVGLLVLATLSLLFGFFMFPIITLAFCETVILACNKWPVIKRVGSEYEVENP